MLSGINPYIVSILPPVNTNPKSIVDIFPRPNPNGIESVLVNKLAAEEFLNKMLSQLKQNAVEIDSGLGYEEYVAITPDVQKLSMEITAGAKTDDEKMYRIEQWVQENIKYTSDIQEYGKSEYWATPTETIANVRGDCEDGAFLVHALGLASGVSSDKLRTYGGIVFDPSSNTPAGHGWTAYKRSIDGQWITLDWCYWAKHDSLDSRKPMSKDLNYIDDFWYVTADKTVETPIANKVRYASHLSNELKGNFSNFYA
jgi:hypothetical protein